VNPFKRYELEAATQVNFADNETLRTLEEKLAAAREQGVPSEARISVVGGYMSSGWLTLRWPVRSTVKHRG
jgi:hypothetical protein